MSHRDEAGAEQGVCLPWRPRPQAHARSRSAGGTLGSRELGENKYAGHGEK